MDISYNKHTSFINCLSPLELLIIGITIIIIIFLIKKIFYKKKETSPLRRVLMSNRNRVYNALSSAGIELYKETFNNNIKFDSVDKINSNFEKFMDIYMPLIDIETINQIFKEYNVNTTIQTEINEKLLNATILFNDPFGFITQGILLAYSSKNQTNLILLGICSALLMKVQNSLLKNHKIIYFDDYNQETTDFVLYFIPPDYNGKVSALKDDNSILDMNEFEINEKTPFKLSLFNQLDKLLKVQINKYKLALEEPDTSIYDTDKIKFIDDLYANREIILTNSRYSLVSLFSFLYDPNTLIILDMYLSPKPTKLSLYIIDKMYNSNYYTPSYYKYITLNLDISKLNTTNKFGSVLMNASMLSTGMTGIALSTSNIIVSPLPTLSTTSTSTTISIPTTTLRTETTTSTMYETSTLPTSTTTSTTEVPTSTSTTEVPSSTSTTEVPSSTSTTEVPSSTSTTSPMLTSSSLITTTSSS